MWVFVLIIPSKLTLSKTKSKALTQDANPSTKSKKKKIKKTYPS